MDGNPVNSSFHNSCLNSFWFLNSSGISNICWSLAQMDLAAVNGNVVVDVNVAVVVVVVKAEDQRI